ncbi:RodZ domain-containing protein [Thalassotalea crassostreae]|uniref:RodZ domain-containing protein n=1 Tax=Thalassotalea crassostreae TaxID=1763536 RepID=UPI000839911D|nr:RodZ domain-containing protein [Thalassotalea crassostreae]
MSNDKEPIDISEDIEVVGPGHILREARKKAGLSIADVAQRLNLRVTLVQEIEAEEYDGNTPETFVRGYLRNYARLVGVDQEEILASYEMLGVAKQQGDEMKSFSQITRKKAENNRLMLVIYLIVFALIVMTFVWYWQDNAANNEPSEVIDTISDPLASSEQGDVSANDSIQLASSTDDEVELTTNDIDEVAQDDQLIFNNSTESTADENVETNTELESAENDAVLVDETEQAEIAVEQPAVLDTFSFTFSGDCWVNIFDADGKRLAWGIKKSGYVMTLTGATPFSITLGKPELVEIDYNQQAIDMSQFQQGQIAKFVWPKQ